jgi:hypothetical protein
MVVPSKKKPAVLNIFLKGKCRVVPKLVPGWYPGLQTLKMHFRSLNLSWGVIVKGVKPSTGWTAAT